MPRPSRFRVNSTYFGSGLVPLEAVSLGVEGRRRMEVGAPLAASGLPFASDVEEDSKEASREEPDDGDGLQGVPIGRELMRRKQEAQQAA